jgi:hypothetical protein
MRGQSSNNGVRYYQCVNRLQKKRPCTQPMVQADPLEEEVAQLVRNIHLPDDWREQVLAEAFPDLDVAGIEARKADLDDRFDRLIELFLSGTIDRPKFDEEELAYRREAAVPNMRSMRREKTTE